ncbi:MULTISPECIES: bifunctional phosphopantothenoylcysteine decarboxylase/phosphopantothenate--cysteine ligase CoaBC [Auritidibacter]|uniref:bifunctional phosphopantothenoylcysteine decarboxylase/phosphopantothenate--cysteine ligase CoaBC n=1 Tax=Auritidibacter TaxID=1160973 RepID=UPI000D72614A|nr:MULTISPECIES: bifunctional phosphopantothenoylcysteine decarboxylase/phosphopantothenate--cysteine ligase CoaBC [Auritidibacter]PXA77879.1 bifunctional phosphopantothenoylcysteine decarboxylase/phosphopantothenate--cysteine ligase CoaBC [Auritidibacter sp. NML100628]WHS34756.1 bifunctional phosphopantothenoylcysteine decarboxylase/phosphopantothenate--cysteine ligase CoaBC [Auritidibacter ignavus]
MRIVLGVCGGIAAYKAALLLRLMTESGHEVHVVPTRSALNFVGEATWEALSGNRVHTDTFEAVDEVNHVRQGRHADLVIIAPATADFLARTAAGLAPDLLGNIMLTATCPILVAPAMHTEMWLNPATQANVATLRERGITVLDPDSGRLTGSDTGQGRLPEPATIWEHAQNLVSPSAGALEGKHLVISAGGTREALDPVRYLGNRSSGKQGVALAVQAARAGAQVTLIAAAMDIPAPQHPRIEVVEIESTRQLLDAVLTHSRGADVLIMAAAVADFRPRTVGESKIKKTAEQPVPVIELEQTEDVLATTVQTRNEEKNLPGLIVGFAAETGDEHGDVLTYGQQKLERKGCEMLVVNQVGVGRVFGQDDTEVTILYADGREAVTATGTKDQVAGQIISAVAEQLSARRSWG